MEPWQGNMMKNESTIDKEQLEYARNLVKHLEAGNRENADKALGDLARFHESAMYNAMGMLTRKLHSALNGFQLDNSIAGLAEDDLPDTENRLNYVIHLTEQAANKTLTAIEVALPICEELRKKARDINNEWKRCMSKNLSVDEFMPLAQEFSVYLESIVSESSKIKANLNDVLVAQGFQDLSGQSIRHVISLVREIEQTLISFIRLTGHKGRPGVSSFKRSKSILEGQHISSKENADFMSCQDEVDDLLSSLGF